MKGNAVGGYGESIVAGEGSCKYDGVFLMLISMI